MTTADCVWAAICPGDVAAVGDVDGDGQSDLDDCRALLRGEDGAAGTDGTDGADGRPGSDGRGGLDGEPGSDGRDGAACWEDAGDQDGDADRDSWDCVWAAICPAPAAEMADQDGDGDVDLDDCRELLRGPAGDPGEPGDGRGDATPEGDADGDGITNAVDSCPFVADPDQRDDDLDGAGNACDPDDDGDLVPDGDDNCPVGRNADQRDIDGDGLGDACDADADGDRTDNHLDNCPYTDNAEQADADGDGHGDACDGDRDGDGIGNEIDSCPAIPNVEQLDLDADGIGDECDTDVDGDGVVDELDTCPRLPNPDRLDNDGDGVGDACDDDDDNDLVADDDDNCPLAPNDGQADRDGDGLGDECDLDRDGDGFDDLDDCGPDDPAVNPAAERDDCDGVDDDCDEDVDEDFEAAECATGEVGVCAAGDLACFNGVVDCVQRVEAGPEACDGLDNDCDGEVDEDDGAGARCQAPASCAAIEADDPDAPSGVYEIDPAGLGLGNEIRVYCELETAGGGWTVQSWLRHPNQWSTDLHADFGQVGDTDAGFASGATLNRSGLRIREKIIIYRSLLESGQDLGLQWMINERDNAIPCGDVRSTSNGWSFRDSFGGQDANAGNVCTHGCTSFRTYGMFHDHSGIGYHGTQGGNYGCRDGNNICWRPRGHGCNVGGNRCALLTQPGQGVVYAVR